MKFLRQLYSFNKRTLIKVRQKQPKRQMLLKGNHRVPTHLLLLPLHYHQIERSSLHYHSVFLQPPPRFDSSLAWVAHDMATESKYSTHHKNKTRMTNKTK